MNTLYVKVIKRYIFFPLVVLLLDFLQQHGNLAKIKDMMWWEL